MWNVREAPRAGHRRLDEWAVGRHQLVRRGWDVDIFERVEKELAGRGAGIVAQAELIARLEALGLDTETSASP